MVHENITEPGPEKDPLFKLRNSPLHGVEAHRSGWYRRLLSAGYKGYLHGSLGGATLFGIGGGILGLGVAVALAPFITGSAAALFLAVPIMASAGILYGKETFGGIAATAAIIAEDSELSENRRTLIDRLEKTQSRGEAEEIAGLIDKQTEEQKPKKWFHWKSAILGAVIVGAAAAIAIGLPGSEEIFKKVGMDVLQELAKKPIGIFIAGAIGAVGGGLIAGIDRSYIRRWFDIQEGLHDDRDVRYKVQEHDQLVDRIRNAKFQDQEMQAFAAPEETQASVTQSADRPGLKINGTSVIEKILSGEQGLNKPSVVSL